ncbi:hypothetical protein CC2G_012438 [Coprinopsis cinerea AmutBmut pab1-1]|nr:hypothetical protein CC2G_012438 [Coprinopsis cinerea AmutBmut pab1-1]
MDYAIAHSAGTLRTPSDGSSVIDSGGSIGDSATDGSHLHVKKLADFNSEDLQILIAEAKIEMAESELKGHFAQLITQAVVTMKVVRANALACILTDGFKYIFGVVVNTEEASDKKYDFYHFESFDWMDKDGPVVKRAKHLLAMTTCWGILNAYNHLVYMITKHANRVAGEQLR